MAGKEKEKKTQPTKYRVLTAMYWSPGKRAHPGDVRDDIPETSLPWLLKQGHITLYDGTVPVLAEDIVASEDEPVVSEGGKS